jgi:hypothetical protein
MCQRLKFKIQSVMVCGRDRLAAKRFASVLIRGRHRMSFFQLFGARNLWPYSKPPGRRNDQSIYRILAVDRAPLPSPRARMRPGTRANAPWSKHNLGRWLWEKSDQAVQARFHELGERRCKEGIPLTEVLWALVDLITPIVHVLIGELVIRHRSWTAS